MKKLLLIGNELCLYNLLRTLLSNEYDIKFLPYSTDRIFNILAKENFDLIFIDTGLSDIVVKETVKEIAEIKNNSKIIFITELPFPEHIQEMIRLNIFDYITSPISKERLHFVINRALASKQIQYNNVKIIEEMQEKIFHLEARLKEKERVLTIINNVSKEITKSLDIDDVIKALVDNIYSALEIEICSILLLDETGHLYIKYAIGLEEGIVASTRIAKGAGISGKVLETKKAIFVEDIEYDKRFTKRNNERYYTKSFISVPLYTKTETIGVLNINNKRSRERFSIEDFELMKEVAMEASIAIEKAKLYKSLQDLYITAVRSLVYAIDMRDHYTHSHSEQVAKYTFEISRALNLDDVDIKLIEQAAQLHDIGKIGIKDFILNKPGPLTKEEFEEMKLHSIKGAEIVEPLEFLQDVAKIIRQVHERYDGKGYPDGIKGEDIVIGAKIIAVADAFDTMCSERIYRKRKLTQEEALEELEKNCGTQFDPSVIKAFLKIMK